MITFGPWVRYSDPRIHSLVEGYAWGPHQREMLLGERPWPNDARANVMSIVGRGDVRWTWRRDDGVAPWWDQVGDPVFGGRPVRGTLRRARNTAARVAQAIPQWKAWCAWRARRDGEAEAARVVEEALEEVDDEGVVGFAA